MPYLICFPFESHHPLNVSSPRIYVKNLRAYYVCQIINQDHLTEAQITKAKSLMGHHYHSLHISRELQIHYVTPNAIIELGLHTDVPIEHVENLIKKNRGYAS